MEKAQSLCSQTEDVVLRNSPTFSALHEDPRLQPLVQTACQCHVLETIHDKCIEGVRGEMATEDSAWTTTVAHMRHIGVDAAALGVREEFNCDLSDCEAAL